MPIATSSVSRLPSTDPAFSVPGTNIAPRGIGNDGTKFFIVRDNSGTVDGSPVDEIIKVDSSGAIDTSFATNGVPLASSVVPCCSYSRT
ncbi:MAG: hypothetical protein IH987_16635 [Planctomycetes bacterium]|nr:hypothetical protein [Planctomycetota bacterium]